MAKSGETAHFAPPPVKSEEETGDDEEASSEEEEESESESEGPQSQDPASKNAEPQSAAKPQTTATLAAAAASASSSEEEEDSESETDTESPPKKPDPFIKPIASKPMDDLEKATSSAAATAAAATTKPRSKPTASGPTSLTAGAKRPPPSTSAGGDADAKEPKRSKRKSAENSDKKAATVDEGKKLFVRVWSEDDEIAILKGIIDYSAKKKVDPFADLNVFHEFIKNKIDFGGTSKQLQDKIRRLKKKYVNNASKEKNGKERIFSNPHEQKAYDLSKKIWGTKKNGGEEAVAAAGETPKVNGTAVRQSLSKGTVPMTPKLEKAGDEAMEDKSLGSEKHGNVSFAPDGRSVQDWVLRDGMEFMEEEDRVEMEKKWKELRTEETALLIKKLELTLAEAKKVYKGLKSSGH